MFKKVITDKSLCLNGSHWLLIIFQYLLFWFWSNDVYITMYVNLFCLGNSICLTCLCAIILLYMGQHKLLVLLLWLRKFVMPCCGWLLRRCFRKLLFRMIGLWLVYKTTNLDDKDACFAWPIPHKTSPAWLNLPGTQWGRVLWIVRALKPPARTKH